MFPEFKRIWLVIQIFLYLLPATSDSNIFCLIGHKSSQHNSDFLITQ